MKKDNELAWSEFAFEDEIWREDSAKERQRSQIQAAVQHAEPMKPVRRPGAIKWRLDSY